MTATIRTHEVAPASTFRAIVANRYGPPEVLELADLPKPETLSERAVLVRVRAAAVNPVDFTFEAGPALRLASRSWRRPKSNRVGVDVAGVVEAVGSGVTRCRPGDEVFGACRGAFGEYVRAREENLALKPRTLTFEEAAAIPVAALTALQGLRDKGGIRAGQRVLVNGAAGGVGTFAVQIAKTYGAHVTGVCSGRNLDLVRRLGADQVVDYSREDFTQAGVQYDLILDNVGNRSLAECRRVLAPQGRLVLVGAKRLLPALLRAGQAILLSRFSRQRLVPFISKITTQDLVTLGELVEAGKVVPVIDRTYTLPETPEALRQLKSGHARGKIVITI